MKLIRRVVEKALLEYSKEQLRILLWIVRGIEAGFLVCCGLCLHAGAYDSFVHTVICLLIVICEARAIDRVRKNHDELAKYYFAPDDEYWEERD